MSESEETVFVEKMAEVEAEPFQQELSDLMDVSETPVKETEDYPVSSTTDQLVDFLPSGVQEAEPEQDLAASPSSSTPQQSEVGGEPEQVTSSPVDSTVSEVEQKPSEPDEVSQTKSEKDLTSCMAKWLMKHNVDKRVIDLVYWKCWKKTAAVFAGMMFILWSLTCCTFLSVLTFWSMSLLTVAFLYRIGMTVFNAVQKTTAEHPFKHLLDEDLELSEESVQKWANETRVCINGKVKTLKKLFLIEDVVESIKFGVMLWLLSYVGGCFSMITIAIIACLYTFTVPVLYERNQEKIDCCLGTVKSKLLDIFSKVQSKLPEKLKFGKAKEE